MKPNVEYMCMYPHEENVSMWWDNVKKCVIFTKNDREVSITALDSYDDVRNQCCMECGIEYSSMI